MELLSRECVLPARAVALVCFQGCSIAWMASDVAPQSSTWPQMAPDVPTAETRCHQMARDGRTAPKNSRWPLMAPDGTRWPQMAPHCPRWLQIGKNGSRWHQMFPDCVEGNRFSPNLDFCSLSSGRSRIRKNVVTAPAFSTWPRCLQMAPDDSGWPQITTQSHYPGKLFY